MTRISAHMLSPRGLSADSATVSQSSVKALVSFLTQQGIGKPAISEHTGLNLAQLDDPEARIPVDHYRALWQSPIAPTNNPALGLKPGPRHNFSEMGIVTHVVINSENLRQGLEDYARLFSEIGRASC